jgi:ABC-type proline/glycine betaine transport system permease subunit
MEEYLLNHGFSHLLSKVIPYLLTIIFGLFLAIIVYRSFRNNKKLAVALSLFFLIVPFIGYFAVCPIYQGDFGVNGKSISIRNDKTKAIKNGLLVLALPSCPYCLESIETLKTIKKRQPKLKIDFGIIGTTDSSTIRLYKYPIDGKFELSFLENESAYTTYTGNNFPTFILIEDGMAIHSWSNNEFGVMAKDKIENR